MLTPRRSPLEQSIIIGCGKPMQNPLDVSVSSERTEGVGQAGVVMLFLLPVYVVVAPLADAHGSQRAQAAHGRLVPRAPPAEHGAALATVVPPLQRRETYLTLRAIRSSVVSNPMISRSPFCSRSWRHVRRRPTEYLWIRRYLVT